MPDSKNDTAKHNPDLDEILELNFVPDWARKPPQQTRWDDERPAHGGRGRDRSRGGERGQWGRDDRGQHDRRARRPRRPREDARGDAPQGRDNRVPDRHIHSGRPESSEQETPVRPPRPRTYAEAPRTSEAVAALDIRIIPDQKGMQAVSHRIQHSRMAYPIMDVASIFLSRPNLTRVRIEVPKDLHDVELYQCRTCGYVSRNQETTMAHLVGAHLEEYFSKEEKISDPPSGTFVCVARCGLSGALLGPPNHHSYMQRVQDVHDDRYPNMDMENYRRHIETVRDEAAIEQWKEEARKQIVYHPANPKSDAETEEMPAPEAVRRFRENIAPSLIHKTRRASIPAPMALHLDDTEIRWRVRRLWEEEEHFPLKMSFALRAAFKHMHLQVFKAGKGIHFVTRVAPDALDAEHVVDEIREVLLYLQEHPGVTRSELLEGLRPGLAMDSETAHEVLSPLSWLIERGHIIEFFNGTLSVPLHKHVLLPEKRRHNKGRRQG